MDYELVITETAENDLDGIYRYYLEHQSEDRALTILSQLKSSMNLIVSAPESWGTLNQRVGRETIKGSILRMKPTRPYLIFYIIGDKQIYITRILHATTNWLDNLDNMFKHLPQTDDVS